MSRDRFKHKETTDGWNTFNIKTCSRLNGPCLGSHYYIVPELFLFKRTNERHRLNGPSDLPTVGDVHWYIDDQHFWRRGQ